jgi:hypothetical protein
MKLSLFALTSILATSSAFVAPSSMRQSTSMSMADISNESTEVAAEELAPIDETPVLPEMSMSMPFMKRPVALTGALAGDVGFDPIGFAKSEDDLMNYREAEVKHARLAMLAAAGWPISEVFDKKIASALNMSPLLDANDRVPSVLNGGLGKVSPLYWIAVIGLAGAIDVLGTMKSKDGSKDYFPGNFDFDPLGVYPKDDEGKLWMQTAEIKNGRLAMIAVFGFAIQEFISKVGVVDETPFFFFPVMETFKMYTNSGYMN